MSEDRRLDGGPATTLDGMMIHAIPSETARKLAIADDHHEHFAEAAGAPLRCCLRHAEAGEPLFLFRYSPAQGAGPYEEVGPVFVHADECAGPERTDAYPADLRTSPRVFRAYNAEGRIVTGELSEPDRFEDTIEGLFANPEVESLQVRSLSHGCFLFAITRS
jgi:hypothetical protein